MSFNKQKETESQKQATRLKTQGKKSSGRGTIQVPITSFHNYEKLDYQSLRKLCETDWRRHVDCIMCNRRQNEAHRCQGCRSARYCSWECKVDDQPHHALVCTQWASFQKPPSKTAGRMLIFPAQSTMPVFAWAKLIRASDGDSPLLTFTHPETHAFFDSFTGTTPNNKLAHMGCINESRAIARMRHRLGHGLFILEWTPPPQTNLNTTWINQSIQAITGLPPGQTWLWTGPIAILALDMNRTSPKTHQYTLSNITLRDVRHAIDFFTLNLRNAAIPPPPPTSTAIISTTTTTVAESRFPFPAYPALKLNTPHHPLARISGITLPIEEVHVSRYLPRATRAHCEGVSAVCAALGLAWVVRVVLVHGVGLDWVYPHDGGSGGGGGGDGTRAGGCHGDGASESGSGSSELGSSSGSASSESGIDPASSDAGSVLSEPGSAAAKGRGQNGMVGEGSIIPTQLDLVFALNEDTGYVEGKRFPRTGDGLVLMHPGREKLRKEHVQALLAFIKKNGVDGKYKLADEGLEKEFRKFWKEFRIRENVPADVPSPYDLRPTLSGVKSGDRFLLCREVFKDLVFRARPGVRVLADGLCVRR